MFQATTEQSVIIQEIVNGTSDVVVEAGPGSGKTTTIVEAMKKLPRSAKVLYLCFNKKIAEEAQTKVPSNVEVATLNSMGYKVLRSFLRAKMNQYKTQNALQLHLGAKWDKETRTVKFTDEASEKMYYKSFNIVIRVVALLKGDLIYKPTVSDVESILERYRIATTIEIETLCNLIITIYTQCVGNTKEIDFDDMIFYPVKNGWKLNAKYDYIFVDEAQDLNLAQFKLVESVAE
jgi:superfamily I DNA/RNA helicase